MTTTITRAEGIALAEEYAAEVQAACERFYAQRFPSLGIPTVTVEPGRKYARIVMADTGRHVHAFVNLTTGAVLKSASWSAPAKGDRYNLTTPEGREACYREIDPYGRYLYVH